MKAKIATTRLADPGDDWHGPIVEITTDDHMTLIVNLPLSRSQTGEDPVGRALDALYDLADAAGAERKSRRDGQGSSSARSKQDREELEDQLNTGLEDSFPGSDPVATVVTSTLPKRA